MNAYDILAAAGCLVTALACFFIWTWSSPRAKIGMPMPLYVRAGYLAFGADRVYRGAELTFLAKHPMVHPGHIDAALLVSVAIQVFLFVGIAWSVYRRRLTAEVWVVLQQIGLASRLGSPR